MTSDIRRSGKLDRQALMAEAERLAGLSDWGADRAFEEGLGRLVEAVEAQPFAASLREAVRVEVTRLLTTRLQLQREAIDHPEILRGEIRRPLVVLGLPRTGTTWLFELLALDPGARAALTWEVAAPCPAPRLDSFATDPRIAQTQAGIDAMLAAAPELATMHPFDATLPAECNAILQFGLPWSSAFADRLRSHIDRQRPAGHGKHRYDPAEFGIDALNLPERFPAYRNRFADLLEDR